MRCLRKIADESRFSVSCSSSDLEVRQLLVQPSIDCLLRRRRLAYAARIQNSRCEVLRVLLSQSDFPWIKLLRADLLYMHTNHVSDICDVCNVCIDGTPIDAADQWEELLRHPKWLDVVSRVFYVNSVLDRSVSSDVSVGGFVCNICTPPACFASSRAFGVSPACQAWNT